jgi:hypothetical protein
MNVTSFQVMADFAERVSDAFAGSSIKFVGITPTAILVLSEGKT